MDLRGDARPAAFSLSRSAGTSSTAGPGRPEVAAAKAMSTKSSSRSARSTRRTDFATASNRRAWSSSWKAFLSTVLRATSCTSATTGTLAFMASASGGTSSVAAGPFCAVTTPTLWEIRA